MARHYASAVALIVAARVRPTEGPPKDETPPGKVASLHNKEFDSTATVPNSGAACKPWQNLQWRYLLAGFGASFIGGDDSKPLLVVSRWALCKTFGDRAQAEVGLKRVGGNDA